MVANLPLASLLFILAVEITEICEFGIHREIQRGTGIEETPGKYPGVLFPNYFYLIISVTLDPPLPMPFVSPVVFVPGSWNLAFSQGKPKCVFFYKKFSFVWDYKCTIDRICFVPVHLDTADFGIVSVHLCAFPEFTSCSTIGEITTEHRTQ